MLKRRPSFAAPNNPNWIFPDDNDLINITPTEIGDVPHPQGILVGSFGVSDSPLTGSPQYNLAPIIVIPEPANYQVLLAAVAVGFSFQLSSRLRRRE